MTKMPELRIKCQPSVAKAAMAQPSDQKNRHEVTSERSKANWRTMAQPAERSKGYTLQSCSPFRNRKDRPHEFYVKKSGCGER